MKYDIGDMIKTRDMFHLEHHKDKPMIVIARWEHSGTEEYKVIVCGHPNEFYYFTDGEISGKYE